MHAADRQPITAAAPVRASPMDFDSPLRRLNASHSAANEAPTAIAIEAATSSGSYLIIGTIWIAAMPE